MNGMTGFGTSMNQRPGLRYSSDYSIRSFKAARRHIRKHDEIPKGTKFKLVSRFVGYDRILVKK